VSDSLFCLSFLSILCWFPLPASLSKPLQVQVLCAALSTAYQAQTAAFAHEHKATAARAQDK